MTKMLKFPLYRPLIALSLGLLFQSKIHAQSAQHIDYALFSEQVEIKLNLPAGILLLIVKQESNFNPHAIHENTDGSVDIGLMQINSRNLAWLKKNYGIGAQDLFEPRVSIIAGGLVLAEMIRLYGYSWSAIGAYNAGTGKSKQKQKLRAQYAEKIAARFHQYQHAKAVAPQPQQDH